MLFQSLFVLKFTLDIIFFKKEMSDFTMTELIDIIGATLVYLVTFINGLYTGSEINSADN